VRLSDSDRSRNSVVRLSLHPPACSFEQSVAEVSRFSRREFPGVLKFFDRAGLAGRSR
jgi:hypothetical protein